MTFEYNQHYKTPVTHKGIEFWYDPRIIIPATDDMLNGGNRDFVFDKANTNSQNIAEFVANVENTLTAFHKNN